MYTSSLLQDVIGYGIMIANGCRDFLEKDFLGRGWLVVRGNLINCCRLVRFQRVLLGQHKGFVFVTNWSYLWIVRSLSNVFWRKGTAMTSACGSASDPGRQFGTTGFLTPQSLMRRFA